ncbi:MAG: hypothetical protein OHK0019_28790 [Saprospiraceae bacterium]
MESNFKIVGYETSQGEFKLQRTSSELEALMSNIFGKMNPRVAKFGKVTNTSVRKITLEDGTKKYFLFADEVREDQVSTIAIGLSTDMEGNILLDDGKICNHRCTKTLISGCIGQCDMTILEECKRLMCSCRQGEGSCESEIIITYTDDK